MNWFHVRETAGDMHSIARSSRSSRGSVLLSCAGRFPAHADRDFGALPSDFEVVAVGEFIRVPAVGAAGDGQPATNSSGSGPRCSWRASSVSGS